MTDEPNAARKPAARKGAVTKAGVTDQGQPAVVETASGEDFARSEERRARMAEMTEDDRDHFEQLTVDLADFELKLREHGSSILELLDFVARTGKGIYI